MLRGPYVEAKPSEGQWNVTLSDDDPDAFAVLLDMAHGLYDRTPTKPTINLLYQIAVLTNKYDMTRTLRPMAAQWIKECASKLRVSSIENLLKSLFIAWEFGERDLFQKLMEMVAESLEKRKDLNTDGKGQDFELLEGMPSLDITDILKIHRDRKYNIIRDQCHATVKTLMNTSTAVQCRRSTIWKHSSEGCQERALGRLLQGASLNGISPIFVFQIRQETGMSLVRLMEKLEAVESFISEKVPCNTIMKLALTRVKEKSNQLPSLLSESQKEYLKNQAAKTGLIMASSEKCRDS